MRIYVFPIEPLAERYSIQWTQWFHEYQNSSGMDMVFVEGRNATGEIKEGRFLDSVNTIRWKTEQLLSFVSCVEEGTVPDGSVLLLHDAWFPGIEGLQYIRNLTRRRFRIYGCLHAGAYDPNDHLALAGCGIWARPFEESLGHLLDGVFVATEYHRELLCERRPAFRGKVHVTGFPMYLDPKKPVVPIPRRLIFPHRLDPEKQPVEFDVFSHIMGADWEVIKTKETCRTKDEYYAELSKGGFALSFALQETWGIAMQEAVLMGCVPIVPNRLSYKEMYPYFFRYSTPLEIPGMIRDLNSRWNLEPVLQTLQGEILSQGQQAIPAMRQIIEEERRA